MQTPLLAGPMPARIVRAAQFHEFVAQLLDWGTQGDVGYVPDWRTQLVAARTVAEVVADVTLGAPTGPSVDIAGPGRRGWSTWPRCWPAGAAAR